MRDDNGIRETVEGPHNIELEQALLGAVLLDNGAALRVTGILKAEDFYDPLHQEIFSAATNVIRDNKIANPVTLAAYFSSYPPISEDLTVPQYLGRLAVNAVTTKNVVDYARAVVELSSRRALCGLGSTIASAATQPSLTISQITGNAITEIDTVMARSRFGVATRASLSDSMKDLMQFIAKDNGEGDRLPTGLKSVDAILGGWRRQQYAIVAGRPSMGKSAFAISTMLRVAQSGLGVMLFSLEMTRRSIAARCLSEMTWTRQKNVPYSDAANGKLTQEQIEQWARAAIDFEDIPLTIDDERDLPVGEIAARVRAERQRMERRGIDLAFVIVDHLGLLQPSNNYKGQKTNEVGEMSSGLASLAKSQNIALLALHQLNRNTEGRDNKRPGLADLRDSGNIEQDADVVGFVYREAYYLERAKYDAGTQQELQRVTELEACRNTMEFLVAKNRNGATQSVPLFCDIACNVVRDLARQ